MLIWVWLQPFSFHNIYPHPHRASFILQKWGEALLPASLCQEAFAGPTFPDCVLAMVLVTNSCPLQGSAVTSASCLSVLRQFPFYSALILSGPKVLWTPQASSNNSVLSKGREHSPAAWGPCLIWHSKPSWSHQHLLNKGPFSTQKEIKKAQTLKASKQTNNFL